MVFLRPYLAVDASFELQTRITDTTFTVLKYSMNSEDRFYVHY